MELRMTGRPRERICKRGHDTEEVGRVPNNGWCRACAKIAEANGGLVPGSKYRRQSPHTLKWERARVKRWLEIVKVQPMTMPSQHGGGNLVKRKAEFEERYAMLEAEVPTP